MLALWGSVMGSGLPSGPSQTVVLLAWLLLAHCLKEFRDGELLGLTSAPALHLSVPLLLILCVELSSVPPQPPPGIQDCHLPLFIGHESQGKQHPSTLSWPPIIYQGGGPEGNFICFSAQLSLAVRVGPRPRPQPSRP